jgi:hypothetical protein
MLASQVAGAVQSAVWVATVQVLTQAPAVQTPGAQLALAGVTHVPVPSPSHEEAAICVEAVGQLAARHCVPAAQIAHWPAAH